MSDKKMRNRKTLAKMGARSLGFMTAFALMFMTTPCWATLKYDVGDYVQDGLVVHLDGIRNVGAGLPHDPAAATWANLVDANNPARIKKNNSSGWRNGAGYYFNYEGVAPGAYEVVGSAMFTAGAATDAQGKICQIKGYAIEVWDGSAWGAAEHHSGASYTYTVGTDPVKVRLTWQWQPNGTSIILR